MRLAQRRVCGKSAGSENEGLARADKSNFSFLATRTGCVRDLNAKHTIVFRNDFVRGLRVLNFDAALEASLDQNIYIAFIRVLNQRDMSPREHAAVDLRAIIRIANSVTFQPVQTVKRLRAQYVNQLLAALSVRAFNGLSFKKLQRVFDMHCPLPLRIHRVEVAAGDSGGASRKRHFFQNENATASSLMSRKCRGEAGSARADNNHVKGRVPPVSIFCLRTKHRSG